MNFSTISISDLNRASTSDMNAAKFGIVKMDHKGTVTDYNENQAQHTGRRKNLKTKPA